MNITLDHHSPIPLYLQIEEQLRDEIKSDEYKNGKKLPNEVALANRLGISRMTLRQAINKLVQEGLLIRKKGVGTVVADVAIMSGVQNWMSFSQEMKALGIEVKNYDLQITETKAPEDICRFFNVQEGTSMVRLTRLRGDIEKPFVYFVSWFNPRINLNIDGDFTRPLYDILEEYNIYVKLSKEELSAMAADKALAKKLQIKAGSPVLKRKRYVFDPGGRPVEWNEGYYRSDSFTYTVESER